MIAVCFIPLADQAIVLSITTGYTTLIQVVARKKATGIYLDNDSEGYDVHHNVIWNTEWSNIQINWNGKDLNIYNNTLWNGSETMGAWHKEGTAFSNVNVWNNIADKNSWEPQADKQKNLTLTSS